ncbi:xanthine dehydrogenase [Clostridium botulinum]|uniref:XdhC family protein n=1 Tax=Clostridium botulinum TaxID=1491 RepID=UPI000471334D|nr:XdhC/CoxI family protein [Clostridium botulinum]AUN00171.1 xanthine dehydrogenase [Clostridium botulinum]AUN18745.1 xanthine dehydrogenase [Clostridium botulinum]MBN3345568.1 xanthine dehydrogenase [Clostridium botulinum]MBN3407999.1 xanthine dehydrogenase [Clostridium botulinum]MBY6872463.1 XdhC family protein [Clostridium botulinum]
MEQNILKKIYKSVDKGDTVALATITHISGSTPGKAGSIMAVWKDGKIEGTVGGGKIEHEIINKAVACIKNNENSTFEYELSENGELGMQCGGEARGFIKIFTPEIKLIIVGAGHIAFHLHKIAKILNFYTVVIDDRKEFANEDRFPNANEIIVKKVDDALAEYSINKNTYIVIVTRGHKDDSLALETIISQDAGYIGMIGSSNKTSYIMNNLLSKGISKENLKKVFAPIGLDIASEKPEEIAVGILSEILLIKNNGTLNHIKNLKNINF